jgi:hypothetical protein
MCLNQTYVAVHVHDFRNTAGETEDSKQYGQYVHVRMYAYDCTYIKHTHMHMRHIQNELMSKGMRGATDCSMLTTAVQARQLSQSDLVAVF